MSNIGGKKREQTSLPEFTKKIGLFEGKVVAINPTAEEFKDILNMELKEDSTVTEYLSKNQDGNTILRVDAWLEEIKTKEKYKVTFFLEDKVKENKDQTKIQYINAVGMCTWSNDVNVLPKWFSAREFREAYVGEEELYNFLRTWLGALDLRDVESTLQIDWKKLMKGNVRDLQAQVDGEFSTNVVALAAIKTVEKEDGSKEYQTIYNKAFLPAYSMKQFRLIDYSKPEVVSGLRQKASKDLKPHERFVLNVTGEYGCRDFFVLKDLREYNANDNLVSSNEVISETDSDY